MNNQFSVSYNRNLDFKNDKLKKFPSTEYYFDKYLNLDSPEVIISSVISVYNVFEFENKAKEVLSKKVKVFKHYQYYSNNERKYLKELVIVDSLNELVMILVTIDFDEIDNSADPSFVNFEFDFHEKGQDNLKKQEEKISTNQVEAGLEIFTTVNAEQKVTEMFNQLVSKQKNITKKERELNVITKNDYGFKLQPFKVLESKIDLKKQYNDGFEEVFDIVIDKLNDESGKGLVLFSGLPGCGKTYLTRHLTNVISKKKIIYIPPDMSTFISDPEFLSFLMKHPCSILLIEDAENVLKSRKSGGSQAVSNLLNLSDGLLGDCLKIQIICTFNCDYTEIDTALKRPGRLIAHYQFKELELEKTRSLFKEVHGEKSEGIEIKSPLTLAQIYNYFDKDFNESFKRDTIGFRK